MLRAQLRRWTLCYCRQDPGLYAAGTCLPASAAFMQKTNFARDSAHCERGLLIFAVALRNLGVLRPVLGSLVDALMLLSLSQVTVMSLILSLFFAYAHASSKGRTKREGGMAWKSRVFLRKSLLAYWKCA